MIRFNHEQCSKYVACNGDNDKLQKRIKHLNSFLYLNPNWKLENLQLITNLKEILPRIFSTKTLRFISQLMSAISLDRTPTSKSARWNLTIWSFRIKGGIMIVVNQSNFTIDSKHKIMIEWTMLKCLNFMQTKFISHCTFWKCHCTWLPIDLVTNNDTKIYQWT